MSVRVDDGGVEFRIATDDHLDHLVAAIREHAHASHGHAVTRGDVLAEVGAEASLPCRIVAGSAKRSRRPRSAVIDRYGDLLRTGNVTGIVDLYSPDAILLHADLPIIVGTEALRRNCTDALATCTIDESFSFDQVAVACDTAIVCARSAGNLTFTNKWAAHRSPTRGSGSE